MAPPRHLMGMVSKKTAATVVGLVLLVAACGTTVSPLNGSSTTSSEQLTTTSLRGEPGDASTDPTVTVPDTTTTTTEPPGPFQLTPNAFFRSGSKDWNNAFIVPGPVVVNDDVYYMFYTGHKAEGAGVDRGSVGYITSPDGTDWSFGEEEPLFDGAGLDWTAQALYASSAHILEDGTWVLWLTADARPFASRGQAIGRATAPGPDGPWKLDAEPAVVPGGEGTWYEKSVGHPSVIKVGDEWRMYFDGFVSDLDSDPDRAIGVATSPDGVTWTVADEPVFRSSVDGWDKARVMAPSVIALDDGYVMTYISTWRREGQGFLADFGYATSEDGLTWARADQNPLLDNRGTIGYITSGFASPVGNEIFIYFDSAASITSPASSIVALVADIDDL
jgi:hypothetical protein